MPDYYQHSLNSSQGHTYDWRCPGSTWVRTTWSNELSGIMCLCTCRVFLPWPGPWKGIHFIWSSWYIYHGISQLFQDKNVPCIRQDWWFGEMWKRAGQHAPTPVQISSPSFFLTISHQSVWTAAGERAARQQQCCSNLAMASLASCCTSSSSKCMSPKHVQWQCAVCHDDDLPWLFPYTLTHHEWAPSIHYWSSHPSIHLGTHYLSSGGTLVWCRVSMAPCSKGTVLNSVGMALYGGIMQPRHCSWDPTAPKLHGVDTTSHCLPLMGKFREGPGAPWKPWKVSTLKSTPSIQPLQRTNPHEARHTLWHLGKQACRT